MDNTLHEYHLRQGLFDRRRKLTITPEYIEYENKNLLADPYTRIEKTSFQDVKYAGEWIVWYEFTVGYFYKISILHDNNKVLTIPLAGYFGRRKLYGPLYSDISRHIGNYFLTDKVNEQLDILHADGSLELQGLKITYENVSFKNPDHVIEWKNVRLKEYFNYFAVADENAPDLHKRFRFDEWNAELVFNVMKTLIAREVNNNP